MERNDRNDWSLMAAQLEVDRRALKRNRVFDKMLIKLDEYREEVQAVADHNCSMQATIYQAISEIFNRKQGGIDTLLMQIRDQIFNIRSLQAQPNEKADLLIDRFHAQKLPGLLSNYQNMEHPKLSHILEELKNELRLAVEGPIPQIEPIQPVEHIQNAEPMQRGEPIQVIEPIQVVEPIQAIERVPNGLPQKIEAIPH
jgi:hypothetical protein